MKKFRLIYLILSILILVPLTSCDLSLILEDSSRIDINKKDNTEENEKSNENKEDKPNENEEVITDYDMNLYVKDYKDNYGYKALANDLEHGELMQDAYKEFYDASLNILNSKKDLTLDSSLIDKETVNFLNVYQTPWFSDSSLVDYYKSAWSVFVAENPIFYFLSNGSLTRTQKLTTTETQSGEVINTIETIEYSFILVGYDNYYKFDERDTINKKIVNMFNVTKDINLKETDYDKVVEINEYLRTNLEYAYKKDGVTPEDSYWAHNIIGLLNYKKGVCECYTKCFKLLSDYYGLNTISVYGMTVKKGEAHAWNYVNLDDNWYGMDTTWNDSNVANQYFLCSKSKMAEDHIPYGETYGITYQPIVPTLSDTSYTI